MPRTRNSNSNHVGVDMKELHAARRLCELFKGRFSEEVAKKLIEDLGGELQAVDFVLNEDASTVSGYLKENADYVRDIRSDSKKIANLLENGIEYEIRQFACGDCDRSWWKKVPCRKQVSKCHNCRVKYDTVPKNKEWGWAKFVCLCGKEFHAFGEMNVTKSKCYQCGLMVGVNCVLPPRKHIGTTKKSNSPHSCNGVDCFNRHDYLASSGMHIHASHDNNIAYNYNYKIKVKSGPLPTQDEPLKCVHPMSTEFGERRVRTPSKKHISTGSTVNTFLSQDSLDTASIATLARITEED